MSIRNIDFNLGNVQILLGYIIDEGKQFSEPNKLNASLLIKNKVKKIEQVSLLL
jgi:hypothetical protein